MDIGEEFRSQLFKKWIALSTGYINIKWISIKQSPLCYLLNSDLSGGWRYPPFEHPGPEFYPSIFTSEFRFFACNAPIRHYFELRPYSLNDSKNTANARKKTAPMTHRSYLDSTGPQSLQGPLVFYDVTDAD